jgi:hypothetical protein
MTMGALLLLAACGGSGAPVTTNQPPTVSLAASPSTVSSGGAALLTWSSTNATACNASGGWSGPLASSGSQNTGALTADNTYSLTCSGAGGTSPAATATVTVSPAPTATLTASPITVASGGSSTLTWTSTNATSCTASGGWSGTLATSGTQSTGALTTSAAYSLTCAGAGGISAVATATVTIGTIPTATLNANPTSVASGKTSTLTWSSTNATSCTGTGGTFAGAKGTTGSQSTGNLTANTTYSLTCSGAGGTSSATSATVTIAPAPTVTLRSNPTTIASGGSSTLTWSSTNATSCTASGGWSGTKSASGAVNTGALTTSTAYTLTCTGTGGTSAPATATVTIGTIPTATLNANPTSIASGQSSTLTWSSTNATSCTAMGGTFAGTKATNGGQSTGALTATTTYSLTCTGAGGTSTAASATVTIAPLPTATLTASPTSIASGGTSTLTWSSTNATSCTATGGTFAGAKATSGSQPTGALTANTTYSLTCTGPGGTSTAATATVTILGLPTASLTANPTSVVSGAASTLTWSSTNATSCTGTGGTFAGSQATSGSQSTGALTANTNYSLTCTGTGRTSAPANATVTIASGTVTVSPKAAGITLWQTQQFTATVPGGGTPVWSVDTVQGGNSTVGTIVSTGTATATYTPGTATGTHTILAVSGSDSGTSTLGVTDLAGVYTYHNDLSRDGANSQEYALTPSNVNASGFGKFASCAVDGAIYGQPLWVANLTVNGARHNVVYVATQHDSLYAFDADASPCVQLWQANLVDAAHGGSAGEASVPYTLLGNASGDVKPEVGVTGTPVIDPSTGIIYVVSKSTASGSFYQRVHAIDLTNGSEKTGSPKLITGTAAGNGDGGTTVTFNAQQENQRPGLAFVNGNVYIAWGSHEDKAIFYGWMMGYHYNGTGFTQTAVFNAAPNVNPGNAGGAGIWMSGGAPAADSSGNLYVLTGNGIFDVTNASSPNDDYGDSLLKLSPSLVVSQYLTPSGQATDNTSDFDFGAGGAAILADLPGTSGFPHHLLICGGKDGHLYVGDRDNLGGLGDSNAVQSPASLWTLGEIFATAAFWNNNLYIASVGKPMLDFPLQSSDITKPLFGNAVTSSHSYGAGGSTPSVSAAGTTNGIVWGLDATSYCTTNSPGCGPAVLYAYDATNALTPLWNSAANAADAAGNAIKFTVPTVANGKVYVGTRGSNTGSTTPAVGELDIYALKP